jgi:hydroxyquinol 1,2-dioxygenase
VQQPDIQPKWNSRGIFIPGIDGIYRFVGIRPMRYPIPDDGPVGQMPGQLGRHPSRPQTAEGYEKLVTHTFVAGDSFLGSDAVFRVRFPIDSQHAIIDLLAC